MTTVDNTSIPTLIAYKLVRRMEANTRTKQTRAQVQAMDTHARMVYRFQAFIKLIMTLAGFVCLTAAGFTWCTPAGFVVAGISCLILSWLTTSQQSAKAPGPDTMRG